MYYFIIDGYAYPKEDILKIIENFHERCTNKSLPHLELEAGTMGIGIVAGGTVLCAKVDEDKSLPGIITCHINKSGDVVPINSVTLTPGQSPPYHAAFYGESQLEEHIFTQDHNYPKPTELKRKPRRR